MTFEEAKSALAADSAALVWAGKDFDALAAQFASDPTPSPYDPPTGRPVPTTIIMSVRQAAAQAMSLPERLVIVKNGAAELSGILAQRERDQIAAQAAAVERHRLFVEKDRARHAAQARRERAFRAFFPTFQAMRARLNAAEAESGEAATPAAMAALHDELATDLAAAVRTMREVGAVLLPAGA